jgi:dTDP-glucose 4,6-dehydratase
LKLLVTGGAGFIGSHFVKYILEKYPDYRVINLDALTYAGNLENLKEVEQEDNHTFVKGSITDAKLLESLFREGIDVVVNFAAESHVDRSILDPAAFVETNVLGTQMLLHAARAFGVRRFVQVSTDEVYGTLGPEGHFTEETPLQPNSPYSASKAAADLMVRAYHETYRFPVIITRCSNNYGSHQFPEKLIPFMICNALHDRPLPLYGDGQQVRDWLHVRDHCSAIDLVVHHGRPGEVYNIGGNNERTNLEVVTAILDCLDKPSSLIRYVEDRPGHDRRYAIDASKIRRELGWEPRYSFEEGLIETVRWYLENRQWWERVQTGEYRNYYEQQYSRRLGAV